MRVLLELDGAVQPFYHHECWHAMMDGYHVLDRQINHDLLYPKDRSGTSVMEEDLHPWRARLYPFFERFSTPLLRVWDKFSGSQPAEDGRMMSRAPKMRLGDHDSRKCSLAKHIYHKDLTPGPFISFTTSPTAIEDLARMRVRRQRGDQTLTVVDPDSRRRDFLPIVDVAAEMDHYQIPDPYGNSNAYYVNHYVCLWQVTKAEMVGHWEWSKLENNENWYREIILPAVERFRAEASTAEQPLSPVTPTNTLATTLGAHGSASGDMDDLPNRLDKLSINETANPHDSVSDMGHRSDDGYNVYSDFDDTDTDDEVEESNATDDMVKIIQDHW